MKILRAKLGKKTYPVIRDDESIGSGVYEDGEWIPPQKKTVYIKANIQPAFQGHYTKLKERGFTEKEAIFISSNQYIFTSRSGSEHPLEADLILYNDCYWKVAYTMPYQNLGYHVEAVAVKVLDSERERLMGDVFGRTNTININPETPVPTDPTPP